MFSVKYHCNAIITGYIDSYCLVCESHLRSEDDINGHIAKPIHTKNLDATNFVEKFKDDCVRKVKKGYFCEFCNILLTTATKVGLHVAEEKHINNKGAQLLRRIGNSIVFHEILINEKAWNGLIDDTCAICNTEFDNELIHKTEITHILNLVQNKVDFGADKSIYRKIDEDSFQCLTCNMVIGIMAIKTHFDEESHKKMYEQCVQAYNELNKDIKSDKDALKPLEQKPATSATIQDKPSTPVKTAVNRPNPFDTAPKNTDIPKETVKKEIPIPKKEETPAKKPTPSTGATKKVETLPDITTEERPTLNKVTQELDDQICKALGAKDYVTNDESGKKWCLVCDWTMEPCVIQPHVHGRHHQTMLKLHKERLQNKKKCQDVTEVKSPKHEEENTLENESKSKILDSVSMLQNNDININFVSNTAMCKKCSKHLEFNYKIIEAHIEEHKKAQPKKETVDMTHVSVAKQKVENVKKTQPGNTHKGVDKKPHPAKTEEDRAESRASRAESRASSVASNKENDEEIEKFAKTHELAYSRNDSKVYCRVCDSRVPSSLKNMKEHVAGLHHKSRAAKWFEHQKKPLATIKTPMKDFVKNIVAIENGMMKDVVINERYCINILSFLMITCMGRVRCEPCDVNLSLVQLDDHKKSLSHERAMNETVIIASMQSEFIREVRPNILHCGYCNTVEEADDLAQHLGSTSHREAKTAASWRLQQYIPEILQHRPLRQEYEVQVMMKALSGDLF